MAKASQPLCEELHVVSAVSAVTHADTCFLCSSFSCLRLLICPSCFSKLIWLFSSFCLKAASCASASCCRDQNV
jgi:hypothetical protein